MRRIKESDIRIAAEFTSEDGKAIATVAGTCSDGTVWMRRRNANGRRWSKQFELSRNALRASGWRVKEAK